MPFGATIPDDPITATQVGYTPTVPLDTFAHPKSLAGRRIAIIREFMPNITANDADTVNVFNTEVIPILQATGAIVLESVNARDIAKGWAVDDPAIPNIDIQSIVATMIPILEPSLFNANTSASAPLTPDLTGGTLLPNSLRETILPISTPLYPAGTDLILKTVDAVTGVSPITDEINLRKLNNGPAGALQRRALWPRAHARRRNDARIKSVLDLSIDFDDLNENGITNEHITFARINDDATGIDRSPQSARRHADHRGHRSHGQRPLSTPRAKPITSIRQMSTREIIMRIMAEYQLDALVYPYETIPPKDRPPGRRARSPGLSYDGRPNRGYNFLRRCRRFARHRRAGRLQQGGLRPNHPRFVDRRNARAQSALGETRREPAVQHPVHGDDPGQSRCSSKSRRHSKRREGRAKRLPGLV